MAERGGIRKLEMLDIEFVRRVANIMGAQSAAARALDDFARRTEAGERVGIYRSGRTLLVGPVLSQEPR